MSSDEWALGRARPVSFASERLVAQLKALAYDAEMLLRATADQTGDAVAAARARTQASLHRARQDAAAAGEALARGARVAGTATGDYVRENPLPAIGIAFLAGLAIGELTRRR
jgi:ElaB/YqjD/DUF883 family membrane-anchored ribosome-binding protein